MRAPNWDPGLRQLRASVVTMAAVLATFFTAWLIEDLAHLHSDVIVLGVVLALSVGRVGSEPGASKRVAGARTLAVVAIVAVGAGSIGTLMLQHVVIGDALFAVAITAGISLRRFGPRGTRLGTLITLPFIALLVTPAAPQFGAAHAAWTAVIAATAVVWVLLGQFVGRRLGWLPPEPPHVPLDVPPRAAAPGRELRAIVGRMPASTKMAVQMGLGLGAAFLVGHQLFPEHWPWVVLTAYIVASGNRGRGDVVYKSVLRLGGAAVGTVAATLLANSFDAGDRWAVVAIFAVIGVASWLRAWTYAFWAAGVTAALALLYGYSGVSGLSLLGDRLEAITVGALIAVAAAWFVLPIRTTQVLRRRVADSLAVLSDYLTAARKRDHEALRVQHQRFTLAVASVEQLGPTLAAHRLLTRRNSSRPHPADAVTAVRALHNPAGHLSAEVASDPALLQDPGLYDDIVRLHTAVTATRRRMGRIPVTDDPPAPRTEGGPALPRPAELHAALDQIGSALG